MKPRIKSVLGSAGVLLLLASCGQLQSLLGGVERPSVRIVDVGLRGISLTDVTVDLTAEIGNPYSVPLPITRLEYAFSSRGRTFFSGKTDEQLIIPAGSRGRIPFSAEIGFAGVRKVLTEVRPGSAIPWTADLAFVVDSPAGALTVPVRQTGELPIPAMPRLRIEGLEWQGLNLDSARAVLKLDIGNLNSFPFDLRGLSYALQIAGVSIGEAKVDQEARFSPGEERSLSIPISFSPRKLGFAGLKLLTSGGFDYRVTGTLHGETPYGLLDLPFKGKGKHR